MARAADQQQAAQESLAALVLPALVQSWDLIDVDDLPGTLPQFRTTVAALVHYYGRAAAKLAVDFFRQVRTDFGAPGAVSVPPVPPTPKEQINQVVNYATRSLWRPKNWPPNQLFVPDEELAFTRLSESSERLVMDSGRDQVVAATRADRQAKGWVRETEPGACSFCLMLAIRSVFYQAYGSKRAAGRASNFKLRGERNLPFVGEGEFKVHDHCRCIAVPVYGTYTPPDRIREAQELWNSSTKGRTGRDARAAFRQAVEGREITGAKGARRYDTPTPAKQRTPQQLAGELRVLEGLPPAKTEQAAQWRAKRVELLRKQLAKFDSAA